METLGVCELVDGLTLACPKPEEVWLVEDVVAGEVAPEVDVDVAELEVLVDVCAVAG